MYEYCVCGQSDGITAELLLKKESREDAEFCQNTLDSVLENYDYLSSVVRRYAQDYAFDRIYKVDLAAMLIACREILLDNEIPDKVAVNEALELVKIYSTEKSAPFVNGVLASVIANKEELKSEREAN